MAKAAQSEGTSEIVAAADRHNQYWQRELHELIEMPMESAIAAEDEDDVGLIA